MSRKNDFTNNIDATIGRKIQELRLAKGLSREQLASGIDVTHQQLQKYEKGSNRISPGRIVLIAQALGTTAQYFFNDIDNFIPIRSTKERLTIELSREFLKIKDVNFQAAIVKLVRDYNKSINCKS